MPITPALWESRAGVWLEPKGSRKTWKEHSRKCSRKTRFMENTAKCTEMPFVHLASTKSTKN